MTYTDARTGITFGYPDGNDNWGPTVNSSLQRLAYLPPTVWVLELGVNAPPASPAEGDRYGVGNAATGAWSTYQLGDIVVWGQDATNSGLAWQRFRPYVGLGLYDRDTAARYVWNGTQWTTEQTPPPTINFSPSDFSGDGRSTPYTVNFPTQVQSDWNNMDTTNPAHIANIPSAIRNFRPASALHLTASTTFSFNGRASRTHTETLATFSFNSAQREAYMLGHGIGASAKVDYDSVSSSTTFVLSMIGNVSFSTASSSSQRASGFTSSTGTLVRTRPNYIAQRSTRIAPSTGRVTLATTSTSSDSFSCRGTVYYGIMGPATT